MRQNKKYWVVIICFLAIMAVFTIFSSTSVSSGLSMLATQNNYLPIIYQQPTPTKTPTPMPSPTPTVTPPIGPIGGTFTSLAVDPNQNDNVYAGHFESGVYKSYDKGQTWYRKSNGLGVLKIQSLASHPTDSNIVYAGTYRGGIYKSMNAAESWFPINGSLLGNHIVYDIEIDKNNPNIIYLATRLGGSFVGYVFKTTNGGSVWTEIFKGDIFGSPDYFYDIDVNPLNSNELYLTTHEHGFYKSTNAGVSFFAINNGVYSDYSARSFAIDPTYAGLIYAGTWHGEAIYRSWNGGSSWVNTRAGIPIGAKVYRTYLDPFGRNQKRVFACTYENGLYASDDFAQSWVSRGLAGQLIYDLLVTDGSPQRWYAATHNNGIFRSTNYGSGWASVMGDLSLNPISSYLYYPTRGNQLAAVFGMGVYQLDHNGLNWQEFEPKLEDKAVLDLAIDDDTLYALTEEALYKFDGSEWRRIGLPVAENDLDQNWLEIYAEAVGESIEMVQPRFEASQLTIDGVLENKVIPHRIRVIDGKVYLLSHGSGAFLRGDDSWAQIDVLDGKVLDLTENHHNNKLFASVCSLDGACQLLTYDGIDWQVQDGKLANIRINSFFSNRNDFFATTEHGIYRWDDVNEDWYQVCESEHDILSMTQAADPCRLAAGGVGEYFISNDCGDTWLQYQTEDAWHYQALIFLPLDPQRLLIGAREVGADIFTIP